MIEHIKIGSSKPSHKNSVASSNNAPQNDLYYHSADLFGLYNALSIHGKKWTHEKDKINDQKAFDMKIIYVEPSISINYNL